jgi:hypothetical protein
VGASRRRELRARAPPPHIEKKGRRRPWAAAHPAVGGARWRIWRAAEELCLLEKKKRQEREMVSG